VRPIAAIVLDMDGMRLDTEPFYNTAWQGAAADLGCPLDDAFYLRLVSRSIADGENELSGRFGASVPLRPIYYAHRHRVAWQTEVTRNVSP
jgi:beta-phosphoglucomutase-like phosphatase (HAD superfamily)